MTGNHSSKIRRFAPKVIITVVAFIAALAFITAPNFLLARIGSQPARILEDIRALDSAVGKHAIEAKKTGSQLDHTGADLFGDTYGPFTVDSIPQVPTSAWSGLSDVVPAEFWSPY